MASNIIESVRSCTVEDGQDFPSLTFSLRSLAVENVYSVIENIGPGRRSVFLAGHAVEHCEDVSR